MRKLLIALIAAALFAAFSGLAGPALAGDSKECPWRITKVGVGKWGNGNQKAGTWYKGSFPVNIPGVTERPAWYVNGSSVGKSQIQTGMRFVPNSSIWLVTGDNSFKVQYIKPPYNGASHECTISGFSWEDVPNGGYKWYLCR